MEAEDELPVVAWDGGEVSFALSDDGTDLVVHVAGKPLGSIQPEHKDQVTKIVSATTCNADDDPECEVCITYEADPLGSLREETYTEHVVVDSGPAIRRGRSRSSAGCPASPRTDRGP